jgi:phenylacetate-coenzyme A ligase PaaK-like adenylate-forming protein
MLQPIYIHVSQRFKGVFIMEDYIGKIKSELESIDRMSSDEFDSLRDEKFRNILMHHYNNPYNHSYRKLLEDHGIKSEADLPKSIEEIANLPIIDKKFLTEGGFANIPCVPKNEVIRNIQTSGSTGAPLLIPHSRKAARRLYGELIVRSMLMNGLDLEAKQYWVTHYTKEFDNWASHLCAQMVGEVVGDIMIDDSTQTSIPQHIKNILEYRPKSSVSAPNFYLALASLAKSMGKDMGDCSLKEVFAGGSAFSDMDRQVIKDFFGLDKLLQFYISAESFTIATETAEKSDYQVHSDEQAIEIVGKDNNPVKEGVMGNILITPLSMDSAPIIRFLQGDEGIYVGKKDRKFDLIKNIRRFNEASIGDGLLPYSEIELMPDYARGKGVPIMAVQVARKKNGLMDLPVIRVESPVEDSILVATVMKEAFFKNIQMRNEVDIGSVCEPLVEIYKPGQLRSGKFKVPLFIDETDK